ncbi:recombinase family protein [Sorangium sp. So ce117]|uniref:recombinase family protein n=1 Tax=Sorangium sp. So ce117 TaxID=3133277 RepID=UPI003F613C46
MSQRAALYARVSTARQEQEKTVASQIEALEKAATAMGLTVPAERRYIDDGISGARLDRPGLDALRDAATDGLIDVVLVYEPDRLACNYVHQVVLVEELTRCGVHVHFVECPATERAEDRLLVQMQGVIAEYERAKIMERTRRGRLHKLRTGQMLPYSSVARYGYAIERSADGLRRTVVINEVEAQHVRAMYRWVREEDLSSRAVARRLNTQGIRPRRAARWTEGRIYGVLTDPTYTGMATYGRRMSVEPERPRKPGSYRKHLKSSSRFRPKQEWLVIPVPPIVDEKEQAEVRTILAKHRWQAPRHLKYDYLLRSLVVCGECGWRMEGHRQAPRSGVPYEYFYYGCRRRLAEVRGHDKRCKAKYIRRDELDAVVWDALVSWIQSPEMLLQEIEAWRSSRAGEDQSRRDRARLESAERKLQTQIERLVDAYQAGAISVEELKARRDRLDAEQRAVRVRIEEIAAQDQNQTRLNQLADDLTSFAATLREGLDKLDFVGRQRLVRLLIERVVVTGDHVAIEHAIPLSGRFSPLRSQDRCAPLPEMRTEDARASHDHRLSGGAPHPRSSELALAAPNGSTRARSNVGTDGVRVRRGVGGHPARARHGERTSRSVEPELHPMHGARALRRGERVFDAR